MKIPDDAPIEKMRRHALDIFHHGLNAVKPQAAIEKCCQVTNNMLTIDTKSYDLAAFNHIWVVGAGKAAASMASAMEQLLGEQITGGQITVKYDHLTPLGKIDIMEAGHPVPDENGIKGTRKIMDIVASVTQDDLVICLISGGGSALLPMPATGMTLEDKQNTIKALLACGATIHEINTIRKHLSAVKGGQLAKLVYPATLITLMLSDVVGDDMDVIASGPTVPDLSTFADCQKIIAKYHLEAELPHPVINHIEKGLRGYIAETPKFDDAFFEKTNPVIIASNFNALTAAKHKAESLGYNTLILSSQLEGDTSESARFHCAIAKEILKTQNPIAPPACILSGGETTVKVTGHGLGGRNQEFALVSAFEIQDQENIIALSAGTDGTDGPTDAAGAIVDAHTLLRARSMGIDPESHLANNDAYHFFKQLDGLLITGPTLTNVMDLHIFLIN